MREEQRRESGICWFTIDEFENRRPETLYHKEQEEGTGWQETVWPRGRRLLIRSIIIIMRWI